MGPLLQDTVLHELILCGLPTNCSSLRTAPIWVYCGVRVLQKGTALVWVSHSWHLLPDHLFYCELLFTDYRSSPESAPAWALPWAEACVVIHYGLQGDSLLHHRLQGNFCSGTWSTSLTHLGVCRVHSFYIFSLLYPSCCCTAVFCCLFSFLKILLQRHNQCLSVLGLTSGKSLLELAGTGSYLTWSSFFSQRSFLQLPLWLPQPCHLSPT